MSCRRQGEHRVPTVKIQTGAVKILPKENTASALLLIMLYLACFSSVLTFYDVGS